MIRLALVIAILAATVSARAADDRFTSEEGRFRIAFPQPPEVEEKAGDTGRHHRYRTVIDGVTYMVDWADMLPEERRGLGEAEVLLHRFRDAIVGEKPVLSEESRTVGGSPGIGLIIDTGSGGRKVFHLYKVGARIYTIAVAGPIERLRTQRPLVERFLDSFQARTVAPPKTGPLTVAQAEPRAGKLGPRRPNWRYRPHDILTARLSVTGFATDTEGHFDLEGTTELLAADGAVISAVKNLAPGAAVEPNLPLDITYELPSTAGDYRIRVSLHDNRSGERTVWEQPLTVQATDTLALVAPAFFRDANAQIPSPAFGRVGEKIYLALRAIGFDRSRDTIDVALAVDVLDEHGTSLLDMPGRAAFKTSDVQTVRSNDFVTFQTAIPLTRIAKAKVRATATDHVSGRTATLELPLEIHEP